MIYENRKAMLHDYRRATRTAARILLFIGGLVATVVGCGWMGTSESVRFNSYQNEREMGRLPPLPTLSDGTNERRAQWDAEDQNPDADYAAGEKRFIEVDPVWDRAESAEKEGNLSLDRELLQKYLDLTRIERDVWSNPTNRQQRRNSAIDRLDALSALGSGSQGSKVEAYLNARRAHDSDEPATAEIQPSLDLIQDVNLKDNVAYLEAAQLYKQKKLVEAAQAFSAIAQEYPQSEKREASLFMTAVATMKTSRTYTPTSGDEAHLNEERAAEHDVAPVDKAWHDAFATYNRLVAQYPRGRYVNDANGWLAYLMLRKHDRAGALVAYYRLLADQRDENARIEAAFSLNYVRHHATDEEIARVEKELERQPDAALAYAYHNIYNYAIDPGASYPPYEEVRDSNGNYDYETSRIRSEEREKEWQKNRSLTTRKALSGVLAFSERLMKRYPKLALGGAFALRASQASVELGNNEAALKFARRALASRINYDQRAEAHWISGLAEHRQRHFDSARKSFQTLLKDHQKSHLTAGAHRYLAMISEDAGNVEDALEQYIAIDYSLDVAYFVDVLMTTEQLAGFIQRHADSPKINELTYALALRYLRSNRWAEARETLRRVRTTGSPGYSIYSSGNNCREDSYGATRCVDPKETDYDTESKPIITSRLVMTDIQTANDLETLEQAVKDGEGDEAKAEALYQVASYQYEKSSLLFYNHVAWAGGRYWNLGELAGAGNYRTTNESEILFNYMQEHDTPARALKTYLEVVARFPRTRAARDALYTAAVCHERLSNYSPYWRNIYEASLHAGSRMVTYADVKAAYPGYQLPRGTYGWQPSTRTVNDASGWAPPPKPPKPVKRPTRTARLKVLVESLAIRLESFWNETGRRWLTAMTILIALWFTWRVAKQNRKLLGLRIGRLRLKQTRQVVSYPWTAIFWIDPVEVGRREKVRQLLEQRRTEFLELARDGESRPILLRSILTHSLLTGLLLSLVWTLHFG